MSFIDSHQDSQTVAESNLSCPLKTLKMVDALMEIPQISSVLRTSKVSAFMYHYNIAKMIESDEANALK
jgi:hypothetical protein